MRVVVWGTGQTGLNTAREMIKQGHEVRLVDEKPAQAGLDLPVTLLSKDDMLWADLVIPSPGIPKHHPMLGLAKKVLSEVEVASSLLTGTLIAITGTNGKTTTTTLIHQILCRAGLDAGIGGNISPPLISLVERNPRYVVAEISTFQMEWIERFRPHIGVCLNITPDHLDRYRDMDEYVLYKKIMFKNQEEGDIAVLNDDDPYLKDVGGRARRAGFSFSSPSSQDGAFIQGSRIFFKGSIEGPGPLLPQDRELGNGLKEDMLASALVARLLDIDSEAAQEVFAAFPGIHHRYEHVATIDGVTFVDDSKATNVGALETALSGMQSRVILILGGKDKGGDFSHIAKRFREKIRLAVVLGEAAGRIRQEIEDFVETEAATDMQQAVRTAFEKAESGDTVLLSPGCASFDMFNSYAHRGDVFRQCVYSIR
ncbi:MAG: UDP-N-acetylmuramoyl-L-alanine--D-glutamate ligase [Desulfomonilia bacterium]|uniref:UDP-N-acetylmuramoylalanine--D-glutamate ligase n=1 Tax=anaerobic digester metagenome TaxID=1263854 RepID=A0A485M4M3_9ZZZZ|nr:UDP-N-acetylmuramoyl-L-alanine--D-glutamate ligase [Pseudomonadota bacterium]HON38091.1 UDP-N-acetylmuramoyl-L-alanine--D-glutamate ligase [Deltaproteobacteria bacterium]HRS56263.1 UDP-N-acetylmuramoyl-L-alanine--D-glutamate ligase [Desulfomonilia bacterium]HPD21701.1 UDP-N-acetylmuramoyl-L-alanine--D-glutamate ligase [Deltaproteobacteria bacterium]HPX18986.1 UDP-N-acetylmuramoyl-L-alanine--D-glutamate ligase [Deltaproteobacteria bacterium]